MPKFCLRYSVATVALLALATSCSSKSLSSTIRSVFLGTPSPCKKIEPVADAIDKAQHAATLARSAKSQQQRQAVASLWNQAIQAMQAVPPDSPKYFFAQKKVAEYLRHLNAAQQKATTTNSPSPFSSFNNQIFDDQLRLYLSYIAALGPPDILIIGSSRALVGVDPTQLQQALASQGKGRLKVFNFGINGGTAKIVDFQLRQLLTPQQLPRLIIWADGARALNSGRADRTYNSLVASQGYKRLIAGNRPTLPPGKPEPTDTCATLPSSSTTSTTSQKSSPSVDLASPTATPEQWQLAGVFTETTRKLGVSGGIGDRQTRLAANHVLLTQQTAPPLLSRLTTDQNPANYSSSAIDASGFLPLNNRFNPSSYYRQTPRVSGRYDTDYQPFTLAGQQSVALNSIKAFAKQKKIPLVFVNLPLTQNYLDPTRQSSERQFRQFMQRQVSSGFIFIDMGRQWLTEYQYFTDPSHLNRYGAAAVSNQLATSRQIPWPEPQH